MTQSSPPQLANKASRANDVKVFKVLKVFKVYHQHPKHLPSICIFANLGVSGNILLHLLGCQLAQGVRLIAKRISEPLRRLQMTV